MEEDKFTTPTFHPPQQKMKNNFTTSMTQQKTQNKFTTSKTPVNKYCLPFVDPHPCRLNFCYKLSRYKFIIILPYFMQGTQKCSQTLLIGIMKNLTNEQRAAIQGVGFGSLLTLKELKIRRGLCKEIANTFDLETEEFKINGQRLNITIEDVDQILALPREGPGIKEISN